jgi:hypothetical protein
MKIENDPDAILVPHVKTNNFMSKTQKKLLSHRNSILEIKVMKQEQFGLLGFEACLELP